jgi:hypothetical protein
VLVPYLTHGRSLVLDALRVILWAAALTALIGPAILAVAPGATGVNAPSAVAGAIAAAALALVPTVTRQMSGRARARSFGDGVP